MIEILNVIEKEIILLGKTHMVIGIAASLAVTHPRNISEIILAVGGGALGALISDIDIETSASRQYADKITMFSLLAVLTVIVLDKFFNIEVINKIMRGSNYERIIIGIFLFMGVCAFGREKPHRTFMHSFLAMLLLSIAINFIWKKVVIYFVVGFLSHLIIDIFNKRKVQIFYPFKEKIALGWFCADGLANNVFFIVGSVVIAAEIVLFIIRFINI